METVWRLYGDALAPILRTTLAQVKRPRGGPEVNLPQAATSSFTGEADLAGLKRYVASRKPEQDPDR